MNDEDSIAKMSTLHHRFWLQSDAERLIAFANDSLTERERLKREEEDRTQREELAYTAEAGQGGGA